MLDPWVFEWVKTELGRCDVCKAGKAVYRSQEARRKVAKALRPAGVGVE